MSLAKLNTLQELRVSQPEMRMLEFVAGRGGEISWDWSLVKPAAKAMVANMINAGLVIEREYVTHAAELHGILKLAITDKGRAVVDALKKATIKPVEIVAD